MNNQNDQHVHGSTARPLYSSILISFVHRSNRVLYYKHRFAGTVVALGTPAQVAALEARVAQRPLLGCFGLTEVLAGVNSGLVVETTAEYVDGGFVIRTPRESASKNWISQGYEVFFNFFDLFVYNYPPSCTSCGFCLFFSPLDYSPQVGGR